MGSEPGAPTMARRARVVSLIEKGGMSNGKAELVSSPGRVWGDM
jgi:hypothetical protein